MSVNHRMLFGSLVLLIWTLTMLLFYSFYVNKYSNCPATMVESKLTLKQLPSLCNKNTSTIVVREEKDLSHCPPCHSVLNSCFLSTNASQEGCNVKRTSLDHAVCPLSKPFKVFLYNVHFPSLFLLENPSLIGSLKVLLVNHDSWANHSSEACVFLAVVGPLKTNLSYQVLQDRIHKLPYWGDKGVNHLLIDLEINSTLDKINTGSAVTANNGMLFKQCAGVFNLNIPPLVKSSQTWSSVPDVFDTPRRHTLYFETAAKEVHIALTAYRNSTLLSELNFKMMIGCEDGVHSVISKHERILGLCQPLEKMFHQCIHSTFYLILGARYVSETYSISAYINLLEALRCGAVPVIIGVDKLPFDNVLEWQKAAIMLPTLPPPRVLSNILTSLQPQVVMDFRRQGQFLINTYFIDQERTIYSSIAVLRSLFYHPPPPFVEFEARTIKLTNSKLTIPPSPRFLNKFSLLQSSSMWNYPPGPFYMYPVTPHSPPYSPDMFHAPSSNKEQTTSTGHLQGGKFRANLRGNYPSEGFTVVALTYKRTEHLPSFLNNFKGCPFLSKIILVWNNEDDPPKGMVWPDIGVPIEVVIVGRNSLNNRFLPFSNIETEAVLALDDDQLVPFKQLELAFRVWRENRDRVVGWYDRTAVWGIDDPQWHYVWNPSCQTSMALTGAAMFHKYYLFLYSYWMPQAARDLVDGQMNGEDIAMNFLIAYISRKPPIKIALKSDLHACKECQDNISLVKGHLNHRKEIINALVKIWGHSTLLNTQFRAEPLLQSSKCNL